MASELIGRLGEFFQRDPLSVVVDVADILLVAVILYRLMLLLRGTRALQMGAGLLLVFVVYRVAREFGMLTLYSMLDGLLASMVLIIVVIFQADIRRALMRFGGRSLWFMGGGARASTVIEEVIRGATALAQKRIGALIVFEREASLDEFVQHGTVLDATVTKELLYGIFVPSFENPLHDGAVLIREGRLWQAGAFLPLTTSSVLDKALGTRHRAGLGISEESDAVVIVVSEERGAISLCFNGNVVRDMDAAMLREVLPGLLSNRGARRKSRSSALASRPSTAGRKSVAGGSSTAEPVAAAATASASGGGSPSSTSGEERDE